MEAQQPLPVETLTYQNVADDVRPKIIQLLAIVGLIVGISRLANAVLYLWSTGLLGESPYGTQVRDYSLITILRVSPVFLSGPALIVAACGMLMNRRWGEQLAVVSECIALAAFPIFLVAIPFQFKGNPLPIVIHQTCSALTSVMASLAFPILLIAILRIYKTAPSRSVR